jgi:hypothetical protein
MKYYALYNQGSGEIVGNVSTEGTPPIFPDMGTIEGNYSNSDYYIKDGLITAYTEEEKLYKMYKPKDGEYYWTNNPPSWILIFKYPEPKAVAIPNKQV